jgi:hypothetical protein
LPFFPHPAIPSSLHVARGSALPAETIVHLPSEPTRAQLRQPPVQALSQQTLSTHWPDLHSLACAHGCPFCFGPQLWFTHPIPGAQSLSLAQTVVQAAAVGSHTNGVQSCSPGMRQPPIPSQVAAMFSALPEHDGLRQTVARG